MSKEMSLIYELSGIELAESTLDMKTISADLSIFEYQWKMRHDDEEEPHFDIMTDNRKWNVNARDIVATSLKQCCREARLLMVSTEDDKEYPVQRDRAFVYDGFFHRDAQKIETRNTTTPYCSAKERVYFRRNLGINGKKT